MTVKKKLIADDSGEGTGCQSTTFFDPFWFISEKKYPEMPFTGCQLPK
jgi:hypothetical protein